MRQEKLSAKILIVGGGIAGLTLSYILGKSGIVVDHIEKKNHLSAENSGILLNSKTLEILQEIGLGQEIRAMAKVYRFAEIYSHKNKRLVRLNLAKLHQQFGETLALARSDLHVHLKKYLISPKPELNTFISFLNSRGPEVSVEFNNGTNANYSLVVGADGPNSQVRSFLFGSQKAHYTGFWCWQWITSEISIPSTETLLEYWGNGKRLGMFNLPNGKLYVYAFFNASIQFDIPKNKWEETLKSQFSNFAGPALKLFAPGQEIQELSLTPVVNVQLPEWHKNNVILIGEAAHTLSPNLGLGTAIAIQDSYHLSQVLHFAPSWKNGLQEFESDRKPEVRKIQRYTNWFAHFAQAEGLILPHLRNLVLRLIPDRFLLKIIARIFL